LLCGFNVAIKGLKIRIIANAVVFFVTDSLI